MHAQLKEGVLPQIRLAPSLRLVGMQNVQRRLTAVAHHLMMSIARCARVQYLLRHGLLALKAEQGGTRERRSANGGGPMTRRLGVWRDRRRAAVLRTVVGRIIGGGVVVVVVTAATSILVRRPSATFLAAATRETVLYNTRK